MKWINISKITKMKFKDSFDVAHSDALTMITIAADKEFLLVHREKEEGVAWVPLILIWRSLKNGVNIEV